MDVTLRETPTREVRGDMAPGEYVVLAVSDNGSGMDKDILARIFEPFFTTKPLGEGTGLGLATVHGIVNQNGGTIHAYSEPGRGSTFKIYLPRVSAPVQTAASASNAVQIGGNETLLLVEDEASILSLAGNILKSRGYTVLSADSPAKALAQAEAFEGTIHLLVTDVVMPGMSGKALRDRLVQSRPNLPTLFISGYTANVIVHHGVVDETVDFLQKPFSGASLVAKVREVLDRKS